MYMQRILFILTVAVLSLFAGEAYAQRDLPGQTGVQFTTGVHIGRGESFPFMEEWRRTPLLHLAGLYTYQP